MPAIRSVSRIQLAVMRAALPCLALAGFVLGCAETPDEGSSSYGAGGYASATADDLRIVDCLLPGRVRRLGTQMTYLEPRRPLRTDQRDCEIRGGEYVAFDRGDYATSLAIWMDQASQGDAQAMTYVGEIYERGLGRPPDYREAARWYRKAADLGFARAQSNLAALYANGSGVERDPGHALRLLASASGLQTAALELDPEKRIVAPPPAPVPLPPGDAAEMAELRSQLAAAQAELQAATRALEAARAERGPQPEKQAPSADRDELERLKAEIDQRRQALAAQERELAQRTADLQANRAALEQEGQAQAARASAGVADAIGRAADLELRAAALDAREAEIEAQRQAFREDGNVRLAALEAELAERQAVLGRQQAELQGTLTEREAQIEALERKVAALESEVGEPSAVRASPVAGPPRIVLLDPKLPASRGPSMVIKLRSGVTTRTVAGKVEPPAEIFSFTINDVSTLVTREGTFRAEVPVAPGGTPVTIVAIDSAGRRASLDFRLEPEVAVAASLPPASAAGAQDPALASVAERVEFGKYHALIIGNNAYQHLPALDMAVRDAQAVAEVLESQYGFQVTLLLDATKRDIFRAFKEMRERLTENDNLLIYYAGHGTYQELNDLQRGYWQPVDAKPDDDFEWIPTGEVLAQVDALSAKQVMVVADSCFSGAFMKTRTALSRLKAGRSAEALVDWYQTRAKIRSRSVLTSGGLEPVLDAGGGGHSIFARAFIDVLKSNAGILEGAELYDEVAARVHYAAQAVMIGDRPASQTPRYSRLRFAGDGELGDFFFVPPA